MNIRLTLLALLSFACQPNDSKENPKIERIITWASCTGPNGDYTTEVHASIDGYTLFHQAYAYRDYTYTNISYNDSIGVALRNDSVVRPLNRREIFVGKGHSFHFIATYPESYFSLNKNGEWVDLLGNSCAINFDSVNNRLTSFKFVNPFDTTQTIRTEYSNWQNFDGFELAKNVLITQADTLTFHFDYDSILVNAPQFQQRKFEDN